ncbi:FadR/GntR family transcriptional regulator [Rhizobium lusitanum]|uniref:FadR/GntR family transcriptional regulator n=1 Tax=Rhizobium lusitanum TaxID=293958 RepID=UPI002485C2B8|nr:FCD domain-containing protein [Rhizobium lusitanum]
MGRLIVQHGWEPGMQLPLEGELAAQFGVGRNALREAVKVLVGKGLIQTARRFGSRVAEEQYWNFLDPDVIRWRLHDRSSHAVFRREVAQLRELIEPGAAAMAANQATDAERVTIVELARRLDDVPSVPVIEADIAFHLAILEATHNSLVIGLRQSLDVILRTLFQADLELNEADLTYDPNPTIHLALALAIEGGRAEEARYIAMAMIARGSEGAGRMVRAHVRFPDPDEWANR